MTHRRSEGSHRPIRTANRQFIRTRDSSADRDSGKGALGAPKMEQHPFGAIGRRKATAQVRKTLFRKIRPRRAGWCYHRVFGGDGAHASEQLSLRERATERRLSISHFAAAFRQSMRASLHRWLMKRRVEIAKQMLILSEFSLSAIALNCGFSHQSHMTKVFTVTIGAPPGVWRRAQRNLGAAKMPTHPFAAQTAADHAPHWSSGMSSKSRRARTRSALPWPSVNLAYMVLRRPWLIAGCLPSECSFARLIAVRSSHDGVSWRRAKSRDSWKCFNCVRESVMCATLEYQLAFHA